METSEHMERICELLNITEPAPTGRYVIYAQGRHLHMCTVKARPGISALVAYLSSHEVNAGLSSVKWNSIESTVRRLVKEKIL